MNGNRKVFGVIVKSFWEILLEGNWYFICLGTLRSFSSTALQANIFFINLKPPNKFLFFEEHHITSLSY